MKEAKEKLASLLPGKMTDRTLIELCAAMREVEVRYSDKWIGASTSCSANVKAEWTAEPATGPRTGPPPKKA
jgi:hypothetical protein